ncbi:hypothetical protein [Cypionkella sp.]|uniref:hypothetical protein n=1 Tax=Cypionkella sp. TaxID=2811411 RepID=UPI00271799E1|nr:hypothetical protein [Cypionkella sp.]MDO8983441.1 hypothetical protein [Cypionkella sp.]MDP2050285.1 hypothetical protein [Cypionkella sp.]
MTEFLGLQQHINAAGFRGGGVVEELCRDGSGKGGRHGLWLHCLMWWIRLR